MEGYCSTGQSLQWAVVPIEEDVNQQMHTGKIFFDIAIVLISYMFR